MGDKIWRLGIFENSKIIAAALVIKVHARRGSFLFIPHGPVVAGGEQIFNFQFSIFKQLVEILKKIAHQEKVSFIRISPLMGDTEENSAMFGKLGFRPAPIHMHAETTWSLDLNPSEEKILADMRKTTRNLIRRAIKEGVEIKIGASERDAEIFNSLYRETVSKHSFTPFSLIYLKNEVKILGSPPYQGGVRGGSLVFTAYYNNEPLASAIVVFYGNSAFYHHGASSTTKYPKIPAAYLLKWEAIREAKRRGHKFYNFWGIVPLKAKSSKLKAGDHPWAGLTLFKTGFGGFETDYLHAQDLILSWRYWLSWVIEALRKKRRNL